MAGTRSGSFDAVIFDLDGLLIDSEPLWHQAEIEVFGRYGLVLTVDMCRSTKGRFVGEVTQYWFDQIGWDGPSPALVAGEVVDQMERLLASEVVLKPGVPEILVWCRSQDMPMAVASSSPHRLIAAALGAHDLENWFDVVCSVDDVGVGKPDPAVFLFAAQALGVAPDRCLVLEDSPTGAQAAVAAGMSCVLVPESRLDLDPGADNGPVAGSGEAGGSSRVRAGGFVIGEASGFAGSGGVDGVLGSLHDLPVAWDEISGHMAERRRRA